MSIHYRLYIIAAVFVVIVLAIIAFLIYPTIKDIKSAGQSIMVNKIRAADLSVENQALANFKENYQNYQPNLNKVNALFVDSQDPINFIEFLEQTATGDNIKENITLVPQNVK